MKTITTAIIMIAFGLAVSGCNKKQEQQEATHDEQRSLIVLGPTSAADIGLKVARVTNGPITGELTLPARVLTNQDNEARVGSLVSGRVHQVFVRAGDAVQQGTILMTIEGLDIGEIKAGYLKAKAAYEYAKASLDRQKKLFQENVGSQKSLLESQAEYDKAQAEFRAEDRRIHSVGLTDELVLAGSGDDHVSGTLPIRSPIAGVVAERNVVIGQFVDAATNAFTILNTQSVWVDAQIYEKDLDRIRKDANAVFIAEGHPQHQHSGRISYIGAVVDQSTRTITVRGEFKNQDLRLKPQMFGELKVTLPAQAKGLLIAPESIVKDGVKEYVFIQVTDSTYERRDITTGLSTPAGIEVRSGLSEYDKVVLKGAFYLKSELKKEEIEGDEH